MGGSPSASERRVQEAIGDMRHEMEICDTRNINSAMLGCIIYPAVGRFGRLRAKKAICDRQGPI